MGVKYDENAKLWINSDNKQLNIVDVSSSDWIWKKLLEHGPKIAQVAYIAFNRFHIIIFNSSNEKTNTIIADQ